MSGLAAVAIWFGSQLSAISVKRRSRVGMTDPVSQYPDWRAVEQAIKAAASKRTAASEPTSLTLGDQLLQARFDRFFSRVFAEGEESGWLLKGGTGLLARVPHARRTQDVDLAASAAGLEEAVEDLRRRVSVDLGDHLRFELARTKETGLGQTQPAVATRQECSRVGPVGRSSVRSRSTSWWGRRRSGPSTCSSRRVALNCLGHFRRIRTGSIRSSTRSPRRSASTTGGEVWVRPHVRDGKPVAGHWRSPRTG
jgi:hypothetical protein